MRGDGDMGKKKVGHASWFKLYSERHGEILNVVSDECAGKAVKAALNYLKTGMPPDNLQGVELVVFTSLKQSADEAIADYQKKSVGGKAGNERRWRGETQTGIGERYPAIPSDRMVSHGIEKKEDKESSDMVVACFPEDREDV